MARSNNIFTRIEKKYVLNEEQYQAILPALHERMVLDVFGKSTVGSIYYDPPHDRIIRSSIEKPAYKEKLRLRCYRTPGDHDTAFVELKKKYKGIVYKRRIEMEYVSAVAFLSGKSCDSPQVETQIGKEISYFLKFYEGIRPSYALFCERTALIGRDDPTLRLTIDANLRYRRTDLDLRLGTHGKNLLPPGHYVMEIKTPLAMPLWMTGLLDKNRIFPSPFSKFGTAYTMELREELEGGHCHNSSILPEE